MRRSVLLGFWCGIGYLTPVDRIAAARARLDEAAAFAIRVKEAGPPCSECRYKTLLGMCGSPAYAVQKFSPSTGEYSSRSETSPEVARSEDGLCGPEALLFEPQSFLHIAAIGIKSGLGNIVAALAAVCLGAGILAMLLGW